MMIFVVAAVDAAVDPRCRFLLAKQMVVEALPLRALGLR